MPRKKLVRRKNSSGIAKIASFTATSISNAYSTYKKKQDQRKIEEIKLKKLAENNKVIQERKELRLKEDQLKKDQDKLYLREESIKNKEKELKLKEEKIKIDNDKLIKKEEELSSISKDLRTKEKELKLREEEQNIW